MKKIMHLMPLLLLIAFSLYTQFGEAQVPESWQTLNNKGTSLYNEGKYDEALPFWEKGKIKALNEFGKEHSSYATSVNNLALLYDEMGNHSKAEPLYIEAKEIYAKTLGMVHPSYATSLNNLASLYDEMGNYPKAEPLYMEVKEIYSKVLGKEHPDYATSLNNLARLYRGMGKYPKAEPLYIEAMEIRAKALGKEHPSYATSLNNLALLYYNMGSYPKAEPLYIEAKEIYSKVLGKEHPEYATSLNNLAALYNNMGNYPKAEPLYIEAMEIRAKALGKEHPSYAQSLNNLALLYNSIGNYPKAEPLYKEAMEIRAKALGKEHPSYAQSLNSLAMLYKNIGSYPKAEPLLIGALEIQAKALGKEHPEYAISLNSLATLYDDMGNYSKAEPLYIEAMEIEAKALGKEHPSYANSLNNLAVLYANMGNYPKAEPFYNEAKEIYAKALGKEHPKYAGSLNNLALLYNSIGNYLKAEPLYLELISQKQKQLIRYFPSLSEKEKQGYHAANQFYFNNFETFCLERYQQNPAITSEWFNLKLGTKALLFNASNKMRNRILGSKDQSLIALYHEWQSKKDFLARVYGMPLSERQKSGIDEKKLEDEANTAEKSLSLKSELFATVADTRQYRWEDVRQKLKEGEAAIEMVRTEAVYAALIVTPQTQTHPEIVVLENGNELEERYSKYYINTIKKELQDTATYNQYWKPIAAKLAGIRKVYFSGDGIYNQINLNTLFNPTAGKYVIDEIEVQVVTSTKDLITNTKATRLGIKDATLFGYPNYNNFKVSKLDSSRALSLGQVKTTEIKTDSASRFFNGESINELPGTKVEIETIEALLNKKNIALHEYMFDEATETAIKNLKNPQVLHIATHGFFLSDLPEPKENERGFAGIDAKKIVENPLLRSGLLFAGVKNAFAKTITTTTNEGEDGILTAYEAMSLDLDQTDLVVMSACETGLGVTSNGEGVYGLQRAFQVAGAKSVLMSLWTVSDEATQQLMTMFYENWLAGKPPREAFRLAQFSLREKYPEPYYWGAFVLVGN